MVTTICRHCALILEFRAFIVACQSIGALFGCIALILFSNVFGVKNSLLIANNAVLLLGSFLFYLSYYVQTTILLIFGRILIGVYSGLASGFIAIYIQELSPSSVRVTCLYLPVSELF